MANLKNAAKSARQAVKRYERNRRYKTTLRTKLKRVRSAVEQNQLEGLDALLKDAVQYVDHSASKGVIHPRTASRYISRLTKAVNRAKA